MHKFGVILYTIILSFFINCIGLMVAISFGLFDPTYKLDIYNNTKYDANITIHQTNGVNINITLKPNTSRDLLLYTRMDMGYYVSANLNNKNIRQSGSDYYATIGSSAKINIFEDKIE